MSVCRAHIVQGRVKVVLEVAILLPVSWVNELLFDLVCPDFDSKFNAPLDAHSGAFKRRATMQQFNRTNETNYLSRPIRETDNRPHGHPPARAIACMNYGLLPPGRTQNRTIAPIYTPRTETMFVKRNVETNYKFMAFIWPTTDGTFLNAVINVQRYELKEFNRQSFKKRAQISHYFIPITWNALKDARKMLVNWPEECVWTQCFYHVTGYRQKLFWIAKSK